jgi:hypothetical protein
MANLCNDKRPDEYTTMLLWHRKHNSTICAVEKQYQPQLFKSFLSGTNFITLCVAENTFLGKQNHGHCFTSVKTWTLSPGLDLHVYGVVFWLYVFQQYRSFR